MNRYKLAFLAIYFSCLTVFGQTREGTLHLFHNEMKAAYPSVVFDFLERYLYDISHSVEGYELNQRMADDKVTVTSGKLSNIKRITPDVPFSILRHENAYNICWTDTLGNPLLGLWFPIKYELLLGMSKMEIEKTMQKRIEACDSSFNVFQTVSSLESLPDSCFRSTPTTNYYAESLNTSTYYQQGISGDISPVFSPAKKWYSAANLFQGVIENIANYRIYIEQNLYGFKQQTYIVTLAQWLNYCKENNLIVYFAIEEEREDGLKAMLIAQSHDLGYNHLMSIVIPDNFVEKQNVVLKAKLNAFIPTDNVKDLYQQYVKKQKKRI